MTFLQPFILWGLPLALIPIIIHLLNRMRYRTQRWAAMSFLFSANRASTRYAKLRQILILACRVLAVLMLVLAIARPLAGGWLGWALSPSPDVVLVLLDHSASMEAHDTGGTESRREQALHAIADAAAPIADRSRFVILENAMRKPQEVEKPDFNTLSGLAVAGPTDTGADLPAMLDAAADWLTHNQTGVTEIWIASDLQRSNWQPDSSRWSSIMARLLSLKQTVRVRLLAMTQQPASNASISITSIHRRELGGQPQIDLTLDIERTDSTPATFPVTVTLDDVRSNFDVTMQGQSLRLHRSLQLDPGKQSGWGKVELPPDGNPRDNTAFFVYGPEVPLRTALFAADDRSGRLLRFAAAPSKQQSCDVITATADTDWSKYAMVVWQGAMPADKVAKSLQAYVESGGAVVFLPPGSPDSNSFAGAGWGAVEDAEKDQAFGVAHWNEQDGPLAKSDEGLSLPLGGLAVTKRQAIVGGGEPLASFADAKPFITARAVGKGEVYFCATLPNTQWSALGDGRVLVPMLQRIEEQGGVRLTGGASLDAGDPSLINSPAGWSSIDAPKKDVRFDAGIYRNESKVIAINRPAWEDAPDKIDKPVAKQLFGAVPLQFFEEHGSAAGALQGEAWRTLLVVMLVALLAEAILSLPQYSTPAPVVSPAPKVEREAFKETIVTS
ncbi:MAG TPA: BatA domain-containing protein [Chthoniobacteraceae bacterium]|nr:BatA domain-containing protein [Chthoniobacteraceae bacterium]